MHAWVQRNARDRLLRHACPEMHGCAAPLRSGSQNALLHVQEVHWHGRMHNVLAAAGVLQLLSTVGKQPQHTPLHAAAAVAVASQAAHVCVIALSARCLASHVHNLPGAASDTALYHFSKCANGHPVGASMAASALRVTFSAMQHVRRPTISSICDGAATPQCVILWVPAFLQGPCGWPSALCAWSRLKSASRLTALSHAQGCWRCSCTAAGSPG